MESCDGRIWGSHVISSEVTSNEVASLLTRAPVGAALLDLLLCEREDLMPSGGRLSCPSEEDEAAVIRSLSGIGFERLCPLIASAGYEVGPWTPGAGESRERVLRMAPARIGLARELVRRFGVELRAGLDLHRQEYWEVDGTREPSFRFSDHTRVYGKGQFSWGGVRTASTRNWNVSPDHLAAWDMTEGECSRSRVRVTGKPRVYEIRFAEDWVGLIRRFPLGDCAGAMAPSWSVIALEVDVVHLTWLGFLLVHDNLALAEENGVIPLRFWGSELSLWLNDCIELENG